MAHNFEMNTADFCSEELLNNRTFDEKFDSQGQAKWGIKGHGENIDKQEHDYYYSFELLQIPESIIILMITLFPIIIIITLKDL